jgi:hypothetical protein
MKSWMELVEHDWEQVKALMPLDLEKTARATGALVRRRKVKTASDLLRLVLGYALGDWSLRVTGAWATVTGLCDLSDVAVLKRLRACHEWLSQLVGAWLLKGREHLRSQVTRLRLIDATVVTKPGSQGTDWRVHLGLNVQCACLDSIEVTDAHGAESFARHSAIPGDILLGDRFYAYADNLGTVLSAGSELAVRISWQNLPLHADGQRLDVINWLKAMETGSAERQVALQTPQGRYELRLLAQRLPQEAADRNRQRLIRLARKKGKTPDERTLFAAGFVILVSNLPSASWNTTQIIALYRLRWQIELSCKRLKSILHLDWLRVQDPVLAQVYLLAKLLAALVVDAFSGQVAARHALWFSSVDRPISLWRLQALLYDGLRNAVCGLLSLSRIMDVLPALERYLCDAPRKRRSQAATARWFLQCFQDTSNRASMGALS